MSTPNETLPAKSDVVQQVRTLVAEVCAVSDAKLKNDKALIEYGLDSARAVDLVVALEDAFGLRIKDEEAAKMHTIDAVVDYVLRRLAAV